MRVVFRSASREGFIDRAVYGTIVVTSVLVLYDGWANLTVWTADRRHLTPMDPRYSPLFKNN